MASNPALTRVVKQFSRSKMSSIKAAEKKAGTRKPVQASTITQTVPKKAKSGMKICRKTNKPAVLRSSITPGTVLILLAGRFAGKRVVFLKQLASGMLLVTGPFKLNGVPLKRVPQSQVIATSTKFDISSLKAAVNDSALEDALFQKDSASKKARKEFFLQEDAKRAVVVSDVKRKLQQQIDLQLIAAVKAVPFAAAYLKSRFSLQRGQAPHSMKF